MTNHTTIFVGLDVHKDSTAVAVAEPGAKARFVGTIGSQLGELLKVLGKLGDAQRMEVVYEAGPCGYDLVRRLRADGYACEVIAPAKVARRAGDRVKTDRRDALHLAEQGRAGALTPVWVLDEADEAIRDLSRARDDAVRTRHKARQRLQAMLLRYGHRYLLGVRRVHALIGPPASDAAAVRAPVPQRDELDGGPRALSGTVVVSLAGSGTGLGGISPGGERSPSAGRTSDPGTARSG